MKPLIAIILILFGALFILIPFAFEYNIWTLFVYVGIGGIFVLAGLFILAVRFIKWTIKD